MLTIFTEDLTNPYKEGDNTIIFCDKQFHRMGEEADVKTFNGTEYKVLNFKRDYSWKEMILPRIKLLSLAILTLGFLFISPKFRKNFTATFAKEEKLQLNILNPKTEIQADEVVDPSTLTAEKACEICFTSINSNLSKGNLSLAKELLNQLKDYCTGSNCSPEIKHDYNKLKIWAQTLEMEQQDAKLEQLQKKMKIQTKEPSTSETKIEIPKATSRSRVSKKLSATATLSPTSLSTETVTKTTHTKNNEARAAYYKELAKQHSNTLSQIENDMAMTEGKFSAYLDKKKTHAEIQK